MLGKMIHTLSRFKVPLLLWFLVGGRLSIFAQDDKIPPPLAEGYLVPATIFEGDTIANFALPVVHIFKPLRLNTREQQLAYRRLVRDVKKALPMPNWSPLR